LNVFEGALKGASFFVKKPIAYPILYGYSYNTTHTGGFHVDCIHEIAFPFSIQLNMVEALLQAGQRDRSVFWKPDRG
jgi:hypothetical protein